MKGWRKICGICLMAVLTFSEGCQVVEKEIPDGRQIKIVLVDEKKIPEKMAVCIKEREEQPFWITYLEGEWLYIGQGYGKQESKGYAIRIDECMEGEEGIRVKTTLLGPGSEESKENEEEQTNVVMRDGKLSKYPYIVWKIEKNEKPVIFK